MLPLFLINKCTEAVILADIACSSSSTVTSGSLAHWDTGQGKFVQSVVPGDVWGSLGQISHDTNIVSLTLKYLVTTVSLVLSWTNRLSDI